MTTNQDYYLLLVDDDREFLTILSDYVRATGFRPLTAASAQEALEVIRTRSHEIVMVISDFQMADMDGMQLRRALFPEYKDIPFAILSGYVTRELALEAVDLKISAFLEKPPAPLELEKIIRQHSAERMGVLNEKRTLEAMFVTESMGILEEIEPLILALESDPGDMDKINTIFRLVHTIKGSSGVLDHDAIFRFAHLFEDLLSKLKSGAMAVTPEIATILLRGFDVLGAMVGAVRHRQLGQFDVEALSAIFATKGSESPGLATAERDGEVGALSGALAETALDKGPKKSLGQERDVIRVPIATLDEFMELSGEITVIRNMVNRLVRTIEKEHPGNRNIGHLGELLEEMHKVNSAMQNKIVDLRKVPLKNTFRPLPRTIRDLSKSLAKDISLEIEGEDLRVDTTISQSLSESLIHVIRNAADHGLETPDERVKKGKSKTGTVRVTCHEAREEIVIDVADDGRGIDSRKVAAKAQEKGLVSAEDLARMNEAQIFNLIFEPGFSTASTVTDVSGRGVGMDMVRTSVEKLRGRVLIQSKIGAGTRFSLHMPIPKSVLIINSLLVRAGTQAFAVPQDHIVRLLRLSPERQREMVKEVEGARLLDLDGRLLPIVNLRTVLHLGGRKRDDHETEEACIVVLKADQISYALRVDDILDSEEIVVKPLGSFFQGLQVYGGATFLGEGGVGLILDVKGLASAAGLLRQAETRPVEMRREAETPNGAVVQDDELLLFELGRAGIYALSLAQIFRMEEFPESAIQYCSDRDVVIYREEITPVVSLLQTLKLKGPGGMAEEGGREGGGIRRALIVTLEGRYFAFEISRILDIARPEAPIDRHLKDRLGIRGMVLVGEQTVTVIDAWEILASLGLVVPRDGETTGFGAITPESLAPLATVISLKTDAKNSDGKDLVTPAGAKAAGDAGALEGWGLF